MANLRARTTRVSIAIFPIMWATAIPALAADPPGMQFLYVESAAAHLGGDPFRIASVRVDLEDRNAQVAHLRSDGVVLKLLRGVSNLKLGADALPQPAPKAAAPGDGPPPPEVEGMGPVGIVAHQGPEDGFVLRRFDSDDPKQLEPLPEFAQFMDRVERSVTVTRSVGGEAIFVQARPFGHVSRPGFHPDRRLTDREVAASDVLMQVLAHPFKLVPLPRAGDGSDGEEFVRSLAPGSATVVEYAGRYFTMAVYRSEA